MPQFISFLRRQVFMGNNGSSGTAYSDVFNVSDAPAIYWEAKLWATSDDTATGVITLEHTDDPSMEYFTNYETAINVSGAAFQTIIGSNVTIPKQFMRAKIRIPSNKFMTIEFSIRTC